MDKLAIDVKNVSFAYETPIKYRPIPRLPLRLVKQKSIQILDSLSLQIRANKVTALVGKNGSGKTTLIKLLLGLRYPDSGEIQIFDRSPQEVSDKVGFCFGGSIVYHRLTARENLEYFGKLYGVRKLEKRIEQVSELLELQPHLDQMVEAFSYGMKAKLALGRAILHEPKLLILDEPTLGIDIEMTHQIRNFIKSLRCTVLLTTHYMEEIDELAAEVCLIDHGQVLFTGTKPKLLETYSSKSVEEAFHNALEKRKQIAA